MVEFCSDTILLIVHGNIYFLLKSLCVFQTCLVYTVGVENYTFGGQKYTFEAQTTHLRLHYTNYTNDFVSATW